MKHSRSLKLLALMMTTCLSTPAFGASHREAPAIAMDAQADITDVYAFKSWDDPNNVVFMMNVIPAQEPSSGPNYFNFDDDVLYQLHLDTNQDGKAKEIVYEFRFKTEIRPPFNDLPIAYANVKTLDGPGSEGLGMRQSYTVTEVRGNKRRKLGTEKMFAVPSNIGPRTTPDYEDLTTQGIYPLEKRW